jgi:hypothetical protein
MTLSFSNIEKSPFERSRYVGYAAGLVFTIRPQRTSGGHRAIWRGVGADGRTIFSDSLSSLSLILETIAEERENDTHI